MKKGIARRETATHTYLRFRDGFCLARRKDVLLERPATGVEIEGFLDWEADAVSMKAEGE